MLIDVRPYKIIDDNLLRQFKKIELADDYLWNNREYLFFFNGKTAIHYLINKYKLTRNDEVCIFTSTNKNYVSTCVSGTIFNYCKLSRVITEFTKMLYIIHEFGIPHPDTLKIIEMGKKLNIPVIEDCAHTLDSEIQNIRVGNFGDYAIYSLAKHFPIEYGGLLTGKNIKPDNEYYNDKIANEVHKKFDLYLPFLQSLSQKRREIYALLSKQIEAKGYRHYQFPVNSTPYFFIFESDRYKEISEKIENEIMMPGRIYIKNWVALFIAPFLKLENTNKILKGLEKIL